MALATSCSRCSLTACRPLSPFSRHTRWDAKAENTMTPTAQATSPSCLSRLRAMVFSITAGLVRRAYSVSRPRSSCLEGRPPTMAKGPVGPLAFDTGWLDGLRRVRRRPDPWSGASAEQEVIGLQLLGVQAKQAERAADAEVDGREGAVIAHQSLQLGKARY